MGNAENNDVIQNGTGWHAAPDALEFVPELNIYDRAVWHNFAAHANRKTGACFPSRDLQAKEIGCSRSKVSESRKKLLETGWLEKETVLGKKGIIERYQWKTIGPSERRSASLPVCPITGRPSDRQTVNEAANQRKPKPEEVKPEETVAAHGAAADVVAVFDAFRDAGLWPIPNYGNRTERSAAERLLKRFGRDRTVGMVARYAETASTDRFMPKGHKPSLFLDNLGAIAARMKMGRAGTIQSL